MPLESKSNNLKDFKVVLAGREIKIESILEYDSFYFPDYINLDEKVFKQALRQAVDYAINNIINFCIDRKFITSEDSFQFLTNESYPNQVVFFCKGKIVGLMFWKDDPFCNDRYTLHFRSKFKNFRDDLM